MPDRYSAVWISPKLAHVLDAKHGNAVAATVSWRCTVQGEGWKLQAMSVSRTSSRKLHWTPEQAIAAMKYMTLAAARASLGSPVEAALAHGARFAREADGLWTVASRASAVLAAARFRSDQDAARTYCMVNGLPVGQPLAHPAPADAPG
jgi:hypothetical protein